MSHDSFALNPLVYNSQTSFNVSNSSFNSNGNTSLLDPSYGTQNTGSFNPGNSYSTGYISSHPVNKNYGQSNSAYNQSALNLQSITLPSNFSTNSQKNYNNNFITSESSFISPNSNTSSYDTNNFDHQYDVNRKSIDDHIKNKLDEQLLSKVCKIGYIKENLIPDMKTSKNIIQNHIQTSKEIALSSRDISKEAETFY